MKICLRCESRFAADDWQCPTCGESPARNQFWNFVPETINPNDFFEAAGFENLARLEASSFWFRSRNDLIVWSLKAYAPDATSFLEIGCGTGYVLSGIQRALPHLALTGAEVHETALQFAHQRIPEATLLQMDARRIPFDSEFDAIGAFDVLEHVQEDALVLAEICRAVRPGGRVLITVPQHEWLWSTADVFAHHRRRYRRGGIRNKVEAAGLEVITITSFVTLLLPLLLASRLRQHGSLGTYDPGGELRINRRLDRALELVMGAERQLIRWSLPLPAGGSLLVIAKKPDLSSQARSAHDVKVTSS